MPTASAASTPAWSTRPSNTWRRASGPRGSARGGSGSCPARPPCGRPAAAWPASSPSSSPCSSLPPTPRVGCADVAEGVPVSKFLQAIERAEHERAGDAAAHASLDGHAVASTPVAPPAPPATDDVVALLEDDRTAVYGSPISRHAGTAHEGAFSALLEPAPVPTPGRLDD